MKDKRRSRSSSAKRSRGPSTSRRRSKSTTTTSGTIEFENLSDEIFRNEDKNDPFSDDKDIEDQILESPIVRLAQLTAAMAFEIADVYKTEFSTIQRQFEKEGMGILPDSDDDEEETITERSLSSEEESDDESSSSSDSSQESDDDRLRSQRRRQSGKRKGQLGPLRRHSSLKRQIIPRDNKRPPVAPSRGPEESKDFDETIEDLKEIGRNIEEEEEKVDYESDECMARPSTPAAIDKPQPPLRGSRSPSRNRMKNIFAKARMISPSKSFGSVGSGSRGSSSKKTASRIIQSVKSFGSIGSASKASSMKKKKTLEDLMSLEGDDNSIKDLDVVSSGDERDTPALKVEDLVKNSVPCTGLDDSDDDYVKFAMSPVVVKTSQKKRTKTAENDAVSCTSMSATGANSHNNLNDFLPVSFLAFAGGANATPSTNTANEVPPQNSMGGDNDSCSTAVSRSNGNDEVADIFDTFLVASGIADLACMCSAPNGNSRNQNKSNMGDQSLLVNECKIEEGEIVLVAEDVAEGGNGTSPYGAAENSAVVEKTFADDFIDKKLEQLLQMLEKTDLKQSETKTCPPETELFENVKDRDKKQPQYHREEDTKGPIAATRRQKEHQHPGLSVPYIKKSLPDSKTSDAVDRKGQKRELKQQRGERGSVLFEIGQEVVLNELSLTQFRSKKTEKAWFRRNKNTDPNDKILRPERDLAETETASTAISRNTPPAEPETDEFMKLGQSVEKFFQEIAAIPIPSPEAFKIVNSSLEESNSDATDEGEEHVACPNPVGLPAGKSAETVLKSNEEIQRIENPPKETQDPANIDLCENMVSTNTKAHVIGTSYNTVEDAAATKHNPHIDSEVTKACHTIKPLDLEQMPSVNAAYITNDEEKADSNGSDSVCVDEIPTKISVTTIKTACVVDSSSDISPKSKAAPSTLSESSPEGIRGNAFPGLALQNKGLVAKGPAHSEDIKPRTKQSSVPSSPAFNVLKELDSDQSIHKKKRASEKGSSSSSRKLAGDIFKKSAIKSVMSKLYQKPPKSPKYSGVKQSGYAAVEDIQPASRPRRRSVRKPRSVDGEFDPTPINQFANMENLSLTGSFVNAPKLGHGHILGYSVDKLSLWNTDDDSDITKGDTEKTRDSDSEDGLNFTSARIAI